MKKKYIVSLVVIGFLLFITLGISCGYGLWLSTGKHKSLESTTLDCFKIYFSNGSNIIDKINIKPVLDEEGMEVSPETLTITNICDSTKDLQLRLNILNDNTINVDGLKINASGHIEQNKALYNSLKETKSNDLDVKKSRLIGIVTVKPNETVRTNIKYWFDEKKTPNIQLEDRFIARYELLDSAASTKLVAKEQLISNTTPKNAEVNFSSPSTDSGLFKKDDYYYFRGSISNNYLSFANKMWRIVSINNDGSIKIITSENVGESNFSDSFNAMDYSGLKYIYYDEIINNKINDYLINWYSNNITSEFDKYVVNHDYCNDTSSEVVNFSTIFGPYNRLVNSKNPSIVCPETKNDFGGIYNQKVGLLTADEVAMAGAVFDTENTNYYLNNGTNYYTMSPSQYTMYKANVFIVSVNGSLTTTQTTDTSGVRPVINLSKDITLTGDGTQNNPYKIEQ